MSIRLRSLIQQELTPSSVPLLAVATIPIPMGKPGQIIIKFHGVAMNPSDVMNSRDDFLNITVHRIPDRH